jgi:hypothetical protein
LAIPVTVIGTPSIMTRRDAPFGTVSVVIIAETAENQWSGASAARAIGNASMILPTGNGSMMTPVDIGSTSPGAQPSNPATALQVACASAIPCAPVPALALPALTISARMRPCRRGERGRRSPAPRKNGFA